MRERLARAVRAALSLASRDRVVLCNCPPDHARRIAEAVVEARLAACVNVLPAVESVYEWEGELARDTESTLLIKTTAAGVAALTERLVALHPYELPEVIALPVLDAEGHAPYLAWLRARVRG